MPPRLVDRGSGGQWGCAGGGAKASGAEVGRCRGGGVLREASRRLPKVLPRSGASVAEPAGPGQLQVGRAAGEKRQAGAGKMRGSGGSRPAEALAPPPWLAPRRPPGLSWERGPARSPAPPSARVHEPCRGRQASPSLACPAGGGRGASSVASLGKLRLGWGGTSQGHPESRAERPGARPVRAVRGSPGQGFCSPPAPPPLCARAPPRPRGPASPPKPRGGAACGPGRRGGRWGRPGERRGRPGERPAGRACWSLGFRWRRNP